MIFVVVLVPWFSWGLQTRFHSLNETGWPGTHTGVELRVILLPQLSYYGSDRRAPPHPVEL